MGEFAHSPLRARASAPVIQTSEALTTARSAGVTRAPLWMPQTLGNQNIQRLFGIIQAKLTVNPPGDVHEQEADRVSEQVMRMPEPQREHACACGGVCSDCQMNRPDEELGYVHTQRIASSELGQTTVLPIVHEVLHSPGQPLDPATRAFMEPRFGQDFSHVRVHTDARAAESAHAVNALAYTVGRDIVFGAGRYAPRGREGQRLLTHELVHTIQQGQVRPDTSELSLTSPHDDSEHETASASEQVVRGLRFGAMLSRAVQIARQAHRAPGEEQAEEFRRATISVVRDPILAALRRNDAISFLNGLRALDPADRAQLERDTAFMGEIRSALHGMSFWIVQVILRFGTNQPLYVRQLSLAVLNRNIQLIGDLLRTYRELRDPSIVPGVLEMLDYELKLQGPLTVVVSHGASAEAVNLASERMTQVLGSLRELKGKMVELHIIPHDKKLTDLPEFASLRGAKTFDGRNYDDLRGVGGTKIGDTIRYAIAEEQLISIPGTPSPYALGFVAAHESGHIVEQYGLTKEQEKKLKEAYEARKTAKGPWLNPEWYTSSGTGEYFAQSTAAYFGRPYSSSEADKKTYTRDWLEKNDPAMYKLLASIYK